MARVAGGVLAAFGMGLVVLAIWIIERQFALRGRLELTAIAMVVGFALLAAFCLPVGYRLLFNRPNRYGSLLSPAGWIGLAIGILSVALLLILYRPSADLSPWGSVAGLVVLACACLIPARNSLRLSTPPTVFPPETDLISLHGFTPPGFVSGVEILNDDKTPMTFVVSELQSSLGISQSDAMRTMFEIHNKGGVLLSMPFDEATRVANLIANAARDKGYPLVCRAVKLG